MVKLIKSLINLTVGLLCLYTAAPEASAEIITIKVPTAPPYKAEALYPQKQEELVEEEVEVTAVESESLFPSKNRNLAFSHFTWGAEAGSSLDLTSHNLSTFDVDVLLGYKNSFLKIAGVGAGIHRSVSSGNYFIPVYGVLRTNFRNKPSLFFMNLQAGYSFNSVGDSETIGDFYGALGVGINLQQSRTAKSYVILSASYQHFNDANKDKTSIDKSYIFFGRLVIGVNF